MTGQDAETTTAPVLPHLQSVERISKLPIVESALGVASGIYGRVKGSSRVVNWTLNHAEGVGVAALAPVASRLEVPIHAVDNILDKGIVIVEEAVPAIKMTPQEMLDNTRHLVAAGLGLNSAGADASLPARVVGAGVGVAATGLATAVTVVEGFVDMILPPEKEAEEDGKQDGKKDCDCADSQEAFKLLLRWQKVTRRLHSAMAEALKRQITEVAALLGRVTEYIFDGKHFKILEIIVATFADLSRTIQDQSASAAEIAKTVAQQLTTLAGDIIKELRSGIASLPGDIIEKFNAIQRYGMDIIRAALQRAIKSVVKEDPVNGSDSDDRARLLIARQDKETCSQPEALQTQAAKSSTESKMKPTSPAKRSSASTKDSPAATKPEPIPEIEVEA